MPFTLGLCCICDSLPKTKCRVIQSARFTIPKAIETSRLNLADVVEILEFCGRNKIHAFRMASGLLPRMSEQMSLEYFPEMFAEQLRKVGEVASKYGIRLSFHPDQFVVIGSPHQHVVESSVRELEYQCSLLDLMEVPASLGVCNVHVGGMYADDFNISLGRPKSRKLTPEEREECKMTSMLRWADVYCSLEDEKIKRYLTIENDEKIFNLQDCLRLSEIIKERDGRGVSVVFDTHHEECYRMSHPEEEPFLPTVESLLPRLLETWTVAGRVPMAHVSNHSPKMKTRRLGAHSDFIERFPDILRQYSQMLPEGQVLTIDVEAKAKEAAIFRLREMMMMMID